jgi:hypothetical protein
MPPIIPFIPAIIGAAGTVGGALANRPNKELQRKQGALASSQAKLLKGRAKREDAFFAQGEPLVAGLTTSLQALLSGDRGQLTKQFGPQLEDLTRQRQSAQKRIDESGPAGGASVQAGLELERASFGERSKLLGTGGQAQAQAGITQLLQLLFGAGGQQGAGATNAAAGASSSLNSLLANDAQNRLVNANAFQSASQIGSDIASSFFPADQTKTVLDFQSLSQIGSTRKGDV